VIPIFALAPSGEREREPGSSRRTLVKAAVRHN
jgi:hypothetical protein